MNTKEEVKETVKFNEWNNPSSTRLSWTNDASVFIKLLGNRSVTSDRVERIKRSIQTIGFLPVPIIVNEKYEIIDGQGRVQAIKELGISPVPYIVCKGAGINECISMNINATRWSTRDYISSYAARGIADYMVLKDFIERYVDEGTSSIHTVIVVLSKHVMWTNTSGVTKGMFKVKRTNEDSEKLLTYLAKFDSLIDNPLGPKQVECIKSIGIFAYDTGLVDTERLLHKVKEKAFFFPPFLRMDDALDVIEKACNDRIRNGHVYLKTIYKQYMAKNNFGYEARRMKESSK